MTSSILRAFLPLLSAAVSFGAGVSFPSTESSVSPDRHWVVRCQTAKQGDGYLHKILLRRVDALLEAQVYASGRSCDVLWSTAGDKLAITDWSGSNISEIYIVENSKASCRPLVVGEADKLILRDELEGHIYHEALRWEGPSQLLIRIFGHTDANPSHGFAYYFLIDITTGGAKFIKKGNTEHS